MNHLEMTKEQYEKMLQCESLEAFIGYVQEQQFLIPEAEYEKAYQALTDRKNGAISDDEAANASGGDIISGDDILPPGGRDAGMYVGLKGYYGQKVYTSRIVNSYCGRCCRSVNFKLIGADHYVPVWECPICHQIMIEYEDCM